MTEQLDRSEFNQAITAAGTFAQATCLYAASDNKWKMRE